MNMRACAYVENVQALLITFQIKESDRVRHRRMLVEMFKAHGHTHDSRHFSSLPKFSNHMKMMRVVQLFVSSVYFTSFAVLRVTNEMFNNGISIKTLTQLLPLPCEMSGPLNWLHWNVLGHSFGHINYFILYLSGIPLHLIDVLINSRLQPWIELFMEWPLSCFMRLSFGGVQWPFEQFPIVKIECVCVRDSRSDQM